MNGGFSERDLSTVVCLWTFVVQGNWQVDLEMEIILESIFCFKFMYLSLKVY